MLLISGLGNGDPRYTNTRHNAGYFALDMLRICLRYEGFVSKPERNSLFKYDRTVVSDLLEFKWGYYTAICLQKTKGFMNTSGKLVKRYYDKMEANEFILCHDDLDLKLGEYKIQKGKSPHGHNGVKSVEEALGTKDFWRIRVGIDNRTTRDIPGEAYVLQRFTKDEIKIMNAALERACEELFLTELFERWL